MTRTRKKKSFVVCLSNDGYAASLEPRGIYVALRDVEAERNGDSGTPYGDGFGTDSGTPYGTPHASRGELAR